MSGSGADSGDSGDSRDSRDSRDSGNSIKETLTSAFKRDDYYRFDLKPQKPTHYSEVLDSVLNRLNSDISNVNTDVNTDIIKDIIKDISRVRDRLKVVEEISQNFKKKDKLMCAFIESVNKHIGVRVSTKSAYDRKYMECSSAIEDLFEDNKYGNPIGTPISFVFDGYHNVLEFTKYMLKLKITTQRDPKDRLVYGDYRLDEVMMDTTDKFRLVFTDIQTNKSILCYAVESGHNLNHEHKSRAEDIDYTGKDVFNAIHDITVRRAVLNYNLTKLIPVLRIDQPRDVRSSILRKVIETMENTLKLLDQGYKYVDIGSNKMLKFNIERSAQCSITAIDPPFIDMFLECGHTLSIEAFKGIVNKGESDDTQSILCPFCKSNLIPDLIDIFDESNAEYKNYYQLKLVSSKDMVDKSTAKYDFEPDTVTDIDLNLETNTALDSISISDSDSDESFDILFDNNNNREIRIYPHPSNVLGDRTFTFSANYAPNLISHPINSINPINPINQYGRIFDEVFGNLVNRLVSNNPPPIPPPPTRQFVPLTMQQLEPDIDISGNHIYND